MFGWPAKHLFRRALWLVPIVTMVACAYAGIPLWLTVVWAFVSGSGVGFEVAQAIDAVDPIGEAPAVDPSTREKDS